MRAVVVLFVLAGLSGGGWYGYKRWFAVPDKPSFKEAPIKRGTIVSTVSATGTVQPLVKVLVGSQVSGTIIRWYADFNAKVTKDFVLAELDQDRYKAQVAQRKAALAVNRAKVEENKAKLATARIQRERTERAYANNAASEYEIQSVKADEDAAAAAVHGAEAQLEASEADLRSAEVDLDKTVIKSPIDGVVISRDVDEGQTVAASLSAPTLFTIANDLGQMQVNAAVSEMDIGKVRDGMDAEFRVDAYPGRKFHGVVTQVRYAETVVDNVVTYTTLINVNNPDLSLRPGMTATILFQVAKADDVVMIPNAALRFNPQVRNELIDWNRPGKGQPLKPRVYRLAGEQLVEVAVELGLKDDAFTELRGGEIKEGDQVVVEQVQRGAGSLGRPPAQRMPRM